jgi:hypothetical protein
MSWFDVAVTRGDLLVAFPLALLGQLAGKVLGYAIKDWRSRRQVKR